MCPHNSNLFNTLVLSERTSTHFKRKNVLDLIGAATSAIYIFLFVRRSKGNQRRSLSPIFVLILGVTSPRSTFELLSLLL